MFFGKIPQSFCIRSFIWCLSCDYRTREFRVGAQVGDFCFDDFQSFMATQITLLYLEFLYGFLCAPMVLIFGIENIELLVFLTDKNILFIVWMYIQNCTSNISKFIFGWCRGPDTHSRHYKCRFRAMSDSENVILLFRSKAVTRGISVLSFYRN